MRSWSIPVGASIWNRNSDSLDLSISSRLRVGRGSSHARRDGRTPRTCAGRHYFRQRCLARVRSRPGGARFRHSGEGDHLAGRSAESPSSTKRTPFPTRSTPGSATFASRSPAAGKSFHRGSIRSDPAQRHANVSLTAKPLLHSSALLRSIVWANLLSACSTCCRRIPWMAAAYCAQFFRGATTWFRATHRAVRIGHVFSVLMIMVGMLISSRAEARWDGYWLMMVGFFLFAGAQLEERSATFQSVLQSVRLEKSCSQDFVTLSPADTLEDALDKAVHTLQDDFPVVRGVDMAGVISRQRILDALRTTATATCKPP